MGHPVYRIYTNMSFYNTTIYFTFIKIAYCQGYMFRPTLGHRQILKENRSKIRKIFFIKTHCGIPNTHNMYLCNLGSVFFEGLKMTQWRSKHVALTIYYFNVCEINCYVIEWQVFIYSIFKTIVFYPTCKWKRTGLLTVAQCFGPVRLQVLAKRNFY